VTISCAFASRRGPEDNPPVTSSALRKSSGGQLTAQLCEINGAHAVKMWAYHTLLTM
jgi:hypothetical protein